MNVRNTSLVTTRAFTAALAVLASSFLWTAAADAQAAPTAEPDGYSTQQGTTLSVAAPGLLANDQDPAGGGLNSNIGRVGPSNGNVSVSDDGSFTYTPNPGFVGRDSFSYAVTDSTQTESNEALVDITVTPTNLPPIAHDDTYSTPQGTPLSVPAPGILDNDRDPEAHSLDTLLVQGPANGTLDLRPNGQFMYTPNPGFTGDDAFTYMARDGQLSSNVATVRITVSPVNQPPVAQDDGFSTPQDTPLQVPGFKGILNNDRDPEFHQMSVVNVSTPAHGTVTLQSFGGFTYRPDQGFSGQDSFTYNASDGSLLSNTATVRITVTGVNRPPVAHDNTYSTPQDTPLVVPCPGVLDNDVDPDGDTLRVGSGAARPNHGSVSRTVCGGFTYRPDPGFAGTDSFTYTATDGHLQTIATVTVRVLAVNRAPVAQNDRYKTPQGTPLVVPCPGVLGNDVDPDGDTLHYTGGLPASHGGIAPTTCGGFTYRPDPSFTGTDSFLYNASDGHLTSEAARVFIEVTAVNRPPVANDDVYSTPQGSTLVVPNVASQGIYGNDVDPEGHALDFKSATQPSNGWASIGNDGGLTYLPNPGFVGTDSFTYIATDGDLDSNVATVTIRVTSANQPPIAHDDVYSTPQNTLLFVRGPGLFDNDDDPENHALSFVSVSDPDHGNVSIGADGGFTYVPPLGFVGKATFDYKITDGQLESNIATVTITVNAVNQPPIAHDDVFSTPQDTTLIVPNVRSQGIFANDSDPEGHEVYLRSTLTGASNGFVSITPDGGGLTYLPDAGFVGTDSFTYTVTDGDLESNVATVTITVTAANQPPIAHDDVYSTPQDTTLVVPNVASQGIYGNDVDPEGHALDFKSATQPSNGWASIGNDGGLTYLPNPGFVGTDSFTYIATDGDLDSNVATVTITVTSANQPPIAHDDVYSTPQNTLLFVRGPGLFDNDDDPENHALSFVSVSDPDQGNVSIGADGGFTYVPPLGFVGTATFDYKITDGQLESNIATVTISVTAVNQPPVAVDNAYSTQQDIALVVPAPGVLGNDNDPEGHALKFILEIGPADGTLSPHPDGSFTYLPNPGFNGIDSFTYRTTDGQLDSNVATVTITVNAVNQPPVAADNAYSTPQDVPLNVPAPGVLGNDNDPEGHALSLVLVSGATSGTLAPHPNGGFTYVPNAGFTGTDSFTYRVTDGALSSNIATVTITVHDLSVNQAPVARDDVYSVLQNKRLVVDVPGVLGNDNDPEGHVLRFLLDTGTTNGKLSPHPDGSFTYIPNPDFFGLDTFTYRATDGHLVSNPATVTIFVDDDVTPPTGCVPSATTLCLAGGRFAVNIDWETRQGDQGSGWTIPRTDESGLFWFFDADNAEVAVKVLDACAVNDRFWVFAGGLTDVATRLTVTDTATNTVKRYENPQGTKFLPIQDNDAFATCSDSVSATAAKPASKAPFFEPTVDLEITTCMPTPTELCLNGGRYRVTAVWETESGDTGDADAVALTPDTGLFQFFSPTNIELVVKVLNGCGVNGHRWVFAAGLTDVEVTLTVTDTVTDESHTYRNPQKTPFQPIQDTDAFQSCP